ncbi:aminodeoxychorismate lyase [Microbacterium sp. Marseille-Q6965]|uniref:aminodeoxychorismate lyase n=1 Tax=Microbacterium sp. Marseille-Q6965 TaxID=2965072 RepID=UPI0021B7A6A8|nr:aminodeoxychorismate lyase [Microbacterium sp. Marseille-Q6965]
MTFRLAYLIDTLPAEDPRTDFAGTFAPIDPDAPALSVSDLSSNRGDGIFESIAVVDGHPQETGPHLDRLAHSARLTDLPVPNLAQLRAVVEHAAAQCPPGEYTVRLLMSRGVQHGGPGQGIHGPTAWLTAAQAPDSTAARERGIRVVTLDRGYDSGAAARAPWLLLGAKTLSYAVNMAALREAKRRGADDAVFVTSDGYVLEAPTATVIIRRGDAFLTPEPTGGILQGTTQLSAFDWLEENGHPTGYEHVPVAALHDADAAWLVSSTRLAAPITHVDGRELPVDRDLTAALNAYLLGPRD